MSFFLDWKKSQTTACVLSGSSEVVGIQRRFGKMSMFRSNSCQSAAACARMTAVSYSVRSHVLIHLMHLEGGKHLIGVAQVPLEEAVVCWQCLCLWDSLHCRLVDDPQHLPPDVGLNLVWSIEVVIDFAQELAEDIGIEADEVGESRVVGSAYSTAVYLISWIIKK